MKISTKVRQFVCLHNYNIVEVTVMPALLASSKVLVTEKKKKCKKCDKEKTEIIL